jgi:hypothetical protein
MLLLFVLIGRPWLQGSIVSPNSKRDYFMPLWPQPGIIPRSALRENSIKTLAYFGRVDAAPAWFTDPTFHNQLNELGVSFEIRTKEWHNYADVDAVLAYRDEAPVMLEHKPATKLYNAWLASAVALVGPEPAYARAGKNGVNMFTVRNKEDVLAAIRTLQNKPALIYTLIAEGALASAPYTESAIRERWLNYFLDQIIPSYRVWKSQGKDKATLSNVVRGVIAMAQQKRLAKGFRTQMTGELNAIADRL